MLSTSLFVLLILIIAQCIYGKKANEPPPIYRRTCELVKHYGYPCEIHTVTTKDGYILTIHRIPSGKYGNVTEERQPVAYLQHGIMDSSAGWVVNEPSKSLGFLLADRGYDVWMGNSRGNTYSEKHVFLNPSQEKFWDFSFNEMGKYDLPATISYVLRHSGADDVSYIGHSQGTTMGFSAFSTNKELASRINMFIALAPVAHLHYAKGLLRFLSNHNIIVKIIMRILGTKQFLPGNWLMKYLARQVCGKLVREEICACPIFLIAGSNTGNMDLKRLPIYMTHTPAGTSMKALWHYSQLIQNGKFQMYDYGWNENIRRYKQPTPPPYYVGEMRVPVAMFTGDLDWLSTVEDVALNLRHNLPNMVYFQMDEKWNHLDFMWAMNAKEKVYDRIFQILDGDIPQQKIIGR